MLIFVTRPVNRLKASNFEWPKTAGFGIPSGPDVKSHWVALEALDGRSHSYLLPPPDDRSCNNCPIDHKQIII